MTISYNLVPIPKWYFADFAGKPLGGGFMQAWSQKDPTSPKTVFQDSGGVNAWPTQTIIVAGVPYSNAILFGANGEQGPFFWQFNSAATDDLYFLQVYDSSANIQFSISFYGAPGGSGGGGTVTTANFLKNYVVNNVFWRNGGTFTNIQSGTVITPSSHAGMQFPDISFQRGGNNSATDSITFTAFGAGLVPLTTDVTPEYYLDFNCTVAGAESYKVIRFPIDLHVKNLEQQTMSAIIWVKSGTALGQQHFSLQIRQSFGTGAAQADVVTPWSIGSQLATNTWTPLTGTISLPTVSGLTTGNGGDDATYLEIALIAGGTGVGEILFAKPKLYLGSIALFAELDTYDQVDSVINMPRTGDIQTSLRSAALNGWLLMNDTTIGSASSGATGRANIDTWQLYNLLWTNVADAYAPVTGGRGATSIADFSANKPIALTLTLGRALASSGTGSGLSARTLGQNTGAETHTLTINEIPAHTHNNPAAGQFVINANAGGPFTLGGSGGLATITGAVTGQGAVTAVSLMQPTTFMNVFIKL